ncbi:tellurite resistance TerB C-terminal domain-containing protein [Dysgonomonas macrotermitis]|uniref:TerB-C domain-containing protein n=1 Tax=Dysgonomonas macrotermitis TaxID=1346286 RepID=A0A1M4YCL9_9BACT|nr:tellurite resistance TerB C-terminal domain-containing protein [Dysgonomonas macrotermitis]SHF03485.1 TerB-C domain-containing protein [Dysgonomonas macrotermitis]
MDGIIDITNESYDLRELYEKDKFDVPSWKHQYIYSYGDLGGATLEQKKFYYVFKESFLKGKYIDLKGNTNYAFILLFNFLEIYDDDKNIDRLQIQFSLLGAHYSETKQYCTSFLLKLLEKIGDQDRINQLKQEDKSLSYNDDYWKLGNRYREKLYLNETDVQLLNKLENPTNNFCDIEACKIEILRLYIALFNELEKVCLDDNVTLQQVFDYIAGIYVKKQYSYQKGSVNYKYSIEETKKYFYQNIFKHAENAVREIYAHKRKLNTDLGLHVSNANDKYNERITSVIEDLLPQLAKKLVKKAHSDTEKELYALNTSRWKIKFEELTDKYKGDYKQFKSDIVALGILNEKNPSIEHIFYEASKFISKYHRETALTLYIYYLHYDLRSESFDNKELTKSIQKNIFESNKQLHDFQLVVSQYINDRDLLGALRSIPPIFETNRKKISVNLDTIKEVEISLSETVNLLNEYLCDDFENEDILIQSIQINDKELEIKITDKKAETKDEVQNIYSSELLLSETQISVLSFFTKNNLSITTDDFKDYAKNNGWFARPIIDGINETCYEFLDDILIEEDDNYYIITENYYQTILAQ